MKSHECRRTPSLTNVQDLFRARLTSLSSLATFWLIDEPFYYINFLYDLYYFQQNFEYCYRRNDILAGKSQRVKLPSFQHMEHAIYIIICISPSVQEVSYCVQHSA